MSKKIAYSRLPVLRFGLSALGCMAFLTVNMPAPLYAQNAVPQAPQSAAAPGGQAQVYTDEQLDALLAPVALYPDDLLTQILMACTYPLEVVDAYRWTQVPAHKDLQGEALTKALQAENWDPSVSSLVPFPQVLSMMNDNLDWMQQVGYAMTTQQEDVFGSIQRLRKQAQDEGHLDSTPQQTVSTQGQTIIIQPAQPNVVYVPSYNPTVVYGSWPYPAYPPVYWPPPAYVPGQALMTGLAFGAGVAITAGLWGWASPNWHGGNVNVNVNRYNNINANRTRLQNSNWQPPARPQGGNRRPPSGPVGQPGRANGLPANGIGRPSVSVPGNIARPPSGLGPNAGNPAIGNGNRPGAGQGGARPNAPGAGNGNRPGGGQGGARPNAPGAGNGNRPGGGQGGARPSTGQRPTVNGGTAGMNGGNRNFGSGNRPSTAQRPSFNSGARPGGGGSAFSGMNQGRTAGQYGQRGAQSRQFSRGAGGGGFRGGGGGGRRR